MKGNMERMQPMLVWLGVACLGLLPPGPLSAQQPKLRVTLKGHTEGVHSVAYSPDGKTLASGWQDGTIKLWDMPAAQKAEKAKPADLKGKDAAGKTTDRERIVGTWRIAKMYANGLECPFNHVTLTFTRGGEVIISTIKEFVAAGVTEEGSFTYRYRLVWPGEIEFPACGASTKSSIGIYEFDGNDRLTICDSGTNKLPTEFTPGKKGDGITLEVLVRVKPGEKPTPEEIAKFKDAVKKAGKLASAGVEFPDQDKARSEAAVQAIKKMGGAVTRDDEAPGKPVTQVNLGRSMVATDEGLKVLKEFKELQILTLGLCFNVTDEGLKEIKELNCLVNLDLGRTKVTDAGMRQLKGLQALTTLFLYQTKITDAGVKELKGLQALRALSLAGTKVTAEGLRELKGLKCLEYLDLSYMPVTAAGLKELKELNALKTLVILNTGITDAGLKELKEALPHCKIIR